MIDPDSIPRLMQAGVIEVAPLAYMRGRTLNDAFIILDEAQNTTRRADEDVPDPARASAPRWSSPATSRRSTCPAGTRSGLQIVQEILDGIEDVYFAD